MHHDLTTFTAGFRRIRNTIARVRPRDISRFSEWLLLLDRLRPAPSCVGSKLITPHVGRIRRNDPGRELNVSIGLKLEPFFSLSDIFHTMLFDKIV